MTIQELESNYYNYWSILEKICLRDFHKPQSIYLEEIKEDSIKIEELAALIDKEKYILDRKKEYPSIVDQLDKIYHEGLEAWKAEIKAIKDLYPKPDLEA